MFIIDKFSKAAEAWMAIGAFSKKNEADDFAADYAADPAAVVVAQTFEEALERQLKIRLGAVARQFEKLGLLL